MFKDFLNQISRSLGGTLGGLVDKLTGKVIKQVQNTHKSFTFQALPKSLEEFQALPEATLSDPYAVAALSVLALTRFPEDREECYKISGDLIVPVTTVNGKDFVVSFDKAKLDALLGL